MACTAKGRLDRREILALGLATVPMLMTGSAHGSEGPITVADLASGDAASFRAGRTVSVRGYLAPSLDGRTFTLTDASPAPCQLCGTLHETGEGLPVVLAARAPDTPVMVSVEVTGRLEGAGTAVRLSDARVRALQ